MPTPSDQDPRDLGNPVHQALQSEDPIALASAATSDEIGRLKEAETVMELRQQRKKRGSRVAMASQTMVGLVAVGGFFANAFQSYNNKQQQQHQSEIDQRRWEREFDRAQQADKYRAFFETSVLATDPVNPDKRLVGYALLQEFVGDERFNFKAQLMLEESLIQELRRNTSTSGLDDEHRNAVVAILTALGHSPDCQTLEHAARSIDKIAVHQAKVNDVVAAQEVFQVYVRRVLGRAAVVCSDLQDFRSVRHPLTAAIVKLPEMAGKRGPLTAAQANVRIAQILREHCEAETTVAGGSDCPEIFEKYAKLCGKGNESELGNLGAKGASVKERIAAGVKEKAGLPEKAGVKGKNGAHKVGFDPDEEVGACELMMEPLVFKAKAEADATPR